MTAAKREGKKKSVANEVVTREYTVNVHKRIHGMLVKWLDRLNIPNLRLEIRVSKLIAFMHRSMLTMSNFKIKSVLSEKLEIRLF